MEENTLIGPNALDSAMTKIELFSKLNSQTKKQSEFKRTLILDVSAFWLAFIDLTKYYFNLNSAQLADFTLEELKAIDKQIIHDIGKWRLFFIKRGWKFVVKKSARRTVCNYCHYREGFLNLYGDGFMKEVAAFIDFGVFKRQSWCMDHALQDEKISIAAERILQRHEPAK